MLGVEGPCPSYNIDKLALLTRPPFTDTLSPVVQGGV